MTKQFFSKNRERLVTLLEEDVCCIFLNSGNSKNKSADENFDFQVNTNFFYLTGIKQEDTTLAIIKKQDFIETYLFIDAFSEKYEKWIGHHLNKKEASAVCGIPVKNILFKEEEKEFIQKTSSTCKVMYLDLENPGNKGFNSFGLQLQNNLNSKEVIIKDIYYHIVKLRMSKQKEEIACLKVAIEATKKGIESLMMHARPSIYEYQLESYFDQQIKWNGNRKLSFKTIAASGKNATTLHYSENNSRLNDGDLILFDLGCKEKEYCADISRTIPINGKFSPFQKKLYKIVLKANQKIINVAKAGMSIKELQSICRNELANGLLKAKMIQNINEVDQYFFHGVSHSIGLDTHDPFIYSMPLPENSIISNEPGLYLKQYNIGIRIEDDLLIKKDGCVNLSHKILKSPKAIESFMEKAKK